jgi:DNA ligase D
MATANKIVLELAGREVPVSSPDKVFFSKRGETKLDLIEYYRAIEDPLIKAIGGRPILMQRFPDGAGGKSFFQKRVPKGAPDWLQTTVVATPNGTTSNAMVVADIAHVAWAVNLGCLGFHGWPHTAAEPHFTDELRIDLDPSKGIELDDIKRVAFQVRELLAAVGIDVYPKTSGSRGLHLFVNVQPGWDSYWVRAAAVALAREMERRFPESVTAKWWKEERGQRVFIDFNQNAPHKTVFATWSARARVGAQVSCPLLWDDVERVDPDELTIATVPASVAEQGNPWAQMYSSPQDISPLLDWYHRDLDAGLGDAPWPPVYPKMPHEPPRVAPSRAKDPDR